MHRAPQGWTPSTPSPQDKWEDDWESPDLAPAPLTPEELAAARAADDAVIMSSAMQASELMRSSNKLAQSGIREELNRQAEQEDRNSISVRHGLVTQFYEPDRKMALHRLKNMRVGDTLVVGHTDTNNLRVACNYQQNHHIKAFFTRTFEYAKRKYLEIRRVE